METTCQSYWPSMKSSMFIITDCCYGDNGWLVRDVKTDFLPLFRQNPFLKWTKTHVGHGNTVCVRKDTRRHGHKKRRTHRYSSISAIQYLERTHTHTDIYTINRQHYRSPLTTVCASVRGKLYYSTETGSIIPFLQ